MSPLTTMLAPHLRRWLDGLDLDAGSHAPGRKACVMEAVAYVAGESWSYRPRCADDRLTDFCISLNDTWDDECRQALKPFVLALVNTAHDGLDQRRSEIAFDWLTRTAIPALLRLADCDEIADRMAEDPMDDMLLAHIRRSATGYPFVDDFTTIGQAARWLTDEMGIGAAFKVLFGAEPKALFGAESKALFDAHALHSISLTAARLAVYPHVNNIYDGTHVVGGYRVFIDDGSRAGEPKFVLRRHLAPELAASRASALELLGHLIAGR